MMLVLVTAHECS